MCAKIYSGQTFGEYCLEGINLRKAGKLLFGDLPLNTKFTREWDKNKTIFEKVGNKCGQEVGSNLLIVLWDYCVVERV